MADFITVRHNIEVAHRLFESRGKCEAIHGHSMWVTMTLKGVINEHGMLDGLDFAVVKRHFRGYLDAYYDHHLLLNENDPWAATQPDPLPGLNPLPGDPTTENIARWIGEEMRTEFPVVRVHVDETAVNGATWERDL